MKTPVCGCVVDVQDLGRSWSIQDFVVFLEKQHRE